MTIQLIPVFPGSISNESILLCDARTLHAFLEVRRDFSTWITSRIDQYGFIENQDFLILEAAPQNWGAGNRGRRKDYHLTLDTAKELAMVERNEKGRQIRRYFIECEKQLYQYERPRSQPYHTAHEKFTPRDTSNLTRLIRQMSSPFRFKYAWSNAIWYALREVTGIPSPHAMEVRHIPLMVEECERILRITERLDEAIVTAEKTAMRRLIRKRENVNKVLADITDQLNEASQSRVNKLPPHILLDLSEFRQRS